MLTNKNSILFLKEFSVKDYTLILIFNLNKDSYYKLDNIIKFSINRKINLILNIDKNSFDFKSLLILKKMIFLFTYNNLKLGIWGVPDCVLRYIFQDGFDFTKYYDISLIKINPLFYKLINDNYTFSSNLISCNKCFVKKNCSGLGILDENQKMWNFRINKTIRMIEKKFLFSNNIINKLHKSFINYIENSSLFYTDRTLRYVKTYTHKKQLKYENRFVYFSRYIHKNELDKEFDFLYKNLLNKDFIYYIYKNLYSKLFMRSFAYSIAELENNKLRESFYLYFINEQILINYLLSKKKLQINKENFDELNYISQDFNLNEEFGLKVYSKIKNKNLLFDFLKDKYSFIFPEELIDIAYSFYFVRRYKNNKLISNKIEFNSSNNEYVVTILQNYFNIYIPKESKLKIEIFALDFDLKGHINKITIYYGNF